MLLVILKLATAIYRALKVQPDETYAYIPPLFPFATDKPDEPTHV